MMATGLSLRRPSGTVGFLMALRLPKRNTMLSLLLLACWVGLPPASLANAAKEPVATDVPISAMLEAGAILEQVPNAFVKSYLQTRMNGILALSNITERVSRFDAFLVELKAASAAMASHTNAVVTTPAVAVPVPKSRGTNTVAGPMEVEALNLLTEYACILLDLEHRGFDKVRKELVDNIDTAGLQPETMSLLRQLIMICDEAERTLGTMGNIKVDSAAETRSLWWKNLGTYGATSVATSDPLPLLQAAAAIVGGREKAKEEKNRKLESETQNHRGRLTNFLFELNIRRSSAKAALGVAEDEFLTKETYDALQHGLQDQNPRTRLATLRKCVGRCPTFREGLYYLAAAYHAMNQFNEAEQCLVTLTSRKSTLLRCDGLLGGAYDILSEYSLRRGDYSNAVQLASQALLNQPDRGSAYNHLSLAFMGLRDAPAAARNLDRALWLEPANGAYLWTAAQLAVVGYSNQDAALTFLQAAVVNGFSDFAAIYACEALRELVASPRGQDILKPRLMATCSKTLLNQQFSITNLAAYTLTNVTFTLRSSYETESGQPHETESPGHVPTLSNGTVYVLGLTRANGSGSRCLMRLTYTCDQHPGRTFETTSRFNYLGQGENQWWREGGDTGTVQHVAGEPEPVRSQPPSANPAQLRELLSQLAK